MPVEIAPRAIDISKRGLGQKAQPIERAIADAKEFSIPGQIENITPRPPCTRPPNCRGCQRPPCRRGIGEEISLIKK